MRFAQVCSGSRHIAVSSNPSSHALTSLSPGLGLPAATMKDITAATYAKMAASVTSLPAALPPDPAQPADMANHLPIIIVGVLQWHGHGGLAHRMGMRVHRA
jgi:hypothetical protein